MTLHALFPSMFLLFVKQEITRSIRKIIRNDSAAILQIGRVAAPRLDLQLAGTYVHVRI